MDFRMLDFGMALCMDALVQVLVIVHLVLCVFLISVIYTELHNTAMPDLTVFILHSVKWYKVLQFFCSCSSILHVSSYQV